MGILPTCRTGSRLEPVLAPELAVSLADLGLTPVS